MSASPVDRAELHDVERFACGKPLQGVVDEVGIGVLISEVAVRGPAVSDPGPLRTVASGEGAGPMGSEALADRDARRGLRRSWRTPWRTLELLDRLVGCVRGLGTQMRPAPTPPVATLVRRTGGKMSCLT